MGVCDWMCPTGQNEVLMSKKYLDGKQKKNKIQQDYLFFYFVLF